ncbi:hypothetical protein POM88_045084 [Heracleum sosnowskyi]|uniref:Uncharacterized protein n=1 Tax=Heracleum sosnowskyi TaxID=360622 RepID=A0AAD8H6Q1_9APIA|nr:hypothetical protein POM88_045084 [Heracleum sosnowskyi]
MNSGEPVTPELFVSWHLASYATRLDRSTIHIMMHSTLLSMANRRVRGILERPLNGLFTRGYLMLERPNPGRNVVLSESAIGTGGLKAVAPSLGANQFDEEDPEEAASLSVYFNWLIFSIVTRAIFGVTFLVWVM